MAERVMLALGPFRFEVGQATYQSLAMSQSWRWSEQARLNREPALQFTGRDPAEIRLQGVQFPGFDAGLARVEEMRALADQGKPLQLVDGLGRVWGSWVIVEVGDTRSVLMDDGQPRRVSFEMKLKAYGEDETVTDYAGGWSPFAMLMPSIDDLIDGISDNPVGVLLQMLGDIAALPSVGGSGAAVDANALSALLAALRQLIDAADTTLRGLHSEWLQTVPDANDPVRQALDVWLAALQDLQTALSAAGLAGLAGNVLGISVVVALQLGIFMQAIQSLRTTVLPLSNGSAATSAAVYDLAQRTLAALDAASQAAQALLEKVS